MPTQPTEYDLIRMEHVTEHASRHVEIRLRELELKEEAGARIPLFKLLDLEEHLRLLEEDLPRLIDCARRKDNTHGD